MELDFTDKHVVITGGTGVLGSSVTKLLLDTGASCSIPCYDKSELESFSHRNHERIFIKTGVDLTNEEEAAAFFAEAVEQNGPLWASVNIAGGFGMSAIEETSAADFMKQINLNLLTCFNSCRTAVGEIRKTGAGGRIVNIASRPALEPRQGAGMTAYTTSKAGVAAFTQALAAEVKDDDILVNAIAPSIIDTPQNRESMPDADFDRWPKPDQLARQIVYLVSADNAVTRGAVVTVYGKS